MCCMHALILHSAVYQPFELELWVHRHFIWNPPTHRDERVEHVAFLLKNSSSILPSFPSSFFSCFLPNLCPDLPSLPPSCHQPRMISGPSASSKLTFFRCQCSHRFLLTFWRAFNPQRFQQISQNEPTCSPKPVPKLSRNDHGTY